MSKLASLGQRRAGVVDSAVIRVRGRVQGVGFRPTVCRFARELGLDGEVINDGEGVLIRVHGDAQRIDALLERIKQEPPPLAAITSISRQAFDGWLRSGFYIAESATGKARTEIAPDAATCPACLAETFDQTTRRHRYPFTNCTYCGPRLSICRSIPFDRATTTMARFALCPQCAQEYSDPLDRRFHAEANACPHCGPKARLVRWDTSADQVDSSDDAIATAADLILAGEILAIKALGGYQLACDATNPEAIARLRSRKQRQSKPFALMARNLEVISHYCHCSDEERAALTGIEAPIVLLSANGHERLPEGVAPGQNNLGFMLPATPLHHLLLAGFDVPLVMTSGNVSDEPQIIDDAEAAAKLASITTYALLHDRPIANRIDDSVLRLMSGKVRLLRRARGYAPASLDLPHGFAQAPDVFAFGADLKAAFCLIQDGRAILSQHLGDLENVATFDDYQQAIHLYDQMFEPASTALAADRHPEYYSSKLARRTASATNLPLVEVQHHHAHTAACLAENGWPLDAPAVLGVVLDGLGYGDDGTIWGAEFLLADYRGYQRLASFKPVAMPGGAQAIREPWRSLYAHLRPLLAEPDCATFLAELPLLQALHAKPLPVLDAMIERGLNSPAASSCGRLFDAVAAAIGICFDRQEYEGEAPARLEARVSAHALASDSDHLAYPFAMVPAYPEDDAPLLLDALPMWRALLTDLHLGVPTERIAARFHAGLAQSVATLVLELSARQDANRAPRFDTIALSGGCFQNKILFELLEQRLHALGFKVLSHALVPSNDGGIALGQAVIAAALGTKPTIKPEAAHPCALASPV